MRCPTPCGWAGLGCGICVRTHHHASPPPRPLHHTRFNWRLVVDVGGGAGRQPHILFRREGRGAPAAGNVRLPYPVGFGYAMDQDLASHPYQHSVRCVQRTCVLVLSCYRPNQPSGGCDGRAERCGRQPPPLATGDRPAQVSVRPGGLPRGRACWCAAGGMLGTEAAVGGRRCTSPTTLCTPARMQVHGHQDQEHQRDLLKAGQDWGQDRGQDRGRGQRGDPRQASGNGPNGQLSSGTGSGGSTSPTPRP